MSDTPDLTTNCDLCGREISASVRGEAARGEQVLCPPCHTVCGRMTRDAADLVMSVVPTMMTDHGLDPSNENSVGVVLAEIVGRIDDELV